jgi:phosphate transport system substrate-binding protein
MPDLLPRRLASGRRHVLPPAVAGLLLLSLAACSSAPASNSGPPATASRAAAITVRITGAGSTFDAPFFGLAFRHYQQQHPGVAISYAAVGSSAGISRFTAGQADFGASDVPASAADLAGARGGPAVQVPVDLGAVVAAYNLGQPGAARLKLTGAVLGRIFLGQITRWDDPAITALNPGVHLGSWPITVVHRADGSGTTYIFSNYLSTVSAAWAARVGTGRSLRWPAGLGEDGNGGVANTLAHTPFSIGYIERSYTGRLITYAAIRNEARNYVTPTAGSIAADAAGRADISPASFSIVNQPAPSAYPISGYSWILLSLRQPTQAAGKALTGLISWLTGPGQAYAASLGYVSLPAAIQQYARAALARVTGPSGTPLTG